MIINFSSLTFGEWENTSNDSFYKRVYPTDIKNFSFVGVINLVSSAVPDCWWFSMSYDLAEASRPFIKFFDMKCQYNVYWMLKADNEYDAKKEVDGIFAKISKMEVFL